MLFNPRTGAARRQAKAIVITVICVWLAIVGAVLFIAGHFIAKFW